MNKPWDKYEAALLINAYVKNKSLKPSKAAVVNKLSKRLRKRATNKGQKIDATFRNRASVDTHLTSVQRLVEGDQQARKHAGKVFVEMVDTYYDDPATFKEILSIAVKEVKPEKNTARIPWDKYETALLIDACLQIRNGSCSRAAMISDLSHKLRERAMNLRIAIDDTYRNENGISMQLTNIQRLLQHDDGAERHVAKIFIEMVEMYENDNAAFNGILTTAQRGTAAVKSNMEDFMDWLSKRVSDGTLADYRYAYSIVEQYARSKGFIQEGNLIDSADAALFAEIISALKIDTKYKYESPKAERCIKEVAEQLYSFANESKKKDHFAVSYHEENNPCRDLLLQYLDRKGLEYIDCRDRRGCLWVLGNEELLGLIEILRKAGLTFKYKKYGGYKTKGKSAWLTMDDTADFQMPEELIDGDEGESIATDPPKNSDEALEKSERNQIESISLSQWRTHDGYKEFLKWLTDKGNLPGVALCYADWVANIGNYLLLHAIADEKVYSILDVSELERVKTLLSNDKKFANYVPDNDSRFWLFAFAQYISFRKDYPANSSSNMEVTSDTEEQHVDKGIDDRNAVNTGDSEPASGPSDNKPLATRTGNAKADMRIEKDDVVQGDNEFRTVLREKFENGFRPNSIIDRNRFKQYYAGYYGSEPDCADDELVDRICKIGVMQNDRVFIRDDAEQSDVIDRICKDVMRAFDEGATCVYYSELYEIYEHDLAERLQIYTLEVMKEALSNALAEGYRHGKHYIQMEGRTPDTDREIVDVMRCSSVPLNYDSLQRKLWYIPLNTIKRCLTTTHGLVLVAPETYFYAYNLPISQEELAHIASLIHDRLEQKSYLSDTELQDLIANECPSVAINTEGFLGWGVRDCLAVLLKDEFSFNGAIISKVGNKLNMSQAYHDYCIEHESLTLDELSAFAKEMSCSVIYWDDVMAVMMRTSRDEFVAKGQVKFDVTATDTVLDELIDGDYMPLQDFKLFLHYPPISVKWNEFVLESYVGSYSKMFTLMHLNYMATECCGAIVRRNSSITDFKALILDVLIHSDEWNTKDEALAMLVDTGYLQRKRYSKIDEILPTARLQRELLQAAAVE